jgi:hypothetical protein
METREKLIETVPGDENIINMCWHQVIILLPDGKYYQWDKVSTKSSVRVEYKKKEVMPGFFKKTPKRIIKMPRKFDGIRYIVSEKALDAIKILYPIGFQV